MDSGTVLSALSSHHSVIYGGRHDPMTECMACGRKVRKGCTDWEWEGSPQDKVLQKNVRGETTFRRPRGSLLPPLTPGFLTIDLLRVIGGQSDRRLLMAHRLAA